MKGQRALHENNSDGDKEFFVATIPVFIRGLTNMLTVMKLAEAYAKKKKFSTDVYCSFRLAPDMYTFSQQVQYAYFLPLDAVTGLTGKTPPHFAYDEKSFEELQRSVRSVIAYLHTLTVKDFKGTAKKRVLLFMDKKTMLPAGRYLHQVALPDFYFHVTVAYAILRHLGVPVGKSDYIGVLTD